MNTVPTELLVGLLGLGALLLFAAERIPSEIVALALLAALALFGVLSPVEALSGFSHPAVVQIAAFLVLSEALARTGVVSILARRIFQSNTPRRLSATIFLLMAAISPWMSNTALVALFLPMLCAVADEKGVTRSRLLLPLSYGAILGGTMTTIGTSSTIFGVSLYYSLTGARIGLFDPLPFAALFFCAAAAWMLVVGARRLPERTPEEEGDAPVDLRELLVEVRVLSASPLIGRTVGSEYLRSTHDLRILALERGGRRWYRVPPELAVHENDRLLVQASPEALCAVAALLRLEVSPDLSLHQAGVAEGAWEYVEVIVGPNARCANLPIGRIEPGSGRTVLAVQRRGRLRTRRVGDILLAFGDSLLFQGPSGLKEEMDRSRDFLFRREIILPVERRRKMAVAVLALVAVLVVGGTGRLPMQVAALVGAVVVVLAGCLTPREMHRALPWNVLLLIAALIPFSIAFQSSGLADRVARGVILAGGPAGPLGAFFLLLLAATALAQIVQPNGVIAVMLPVGVATAKRLGIDPTAFVLGVLYAAAYSLATPFAYNTNVMVTPKAGYRFGDFLRQGLPLLVLFLLLAVAFLPVLHPFR